MNGSDWERKPQIPDNAGTDREDEYIPERRPRQRFRRGGRGAPIGVVRQILLRAAIGVAAAIVIIYGLLILFPDLK